MKAGATLLTASIFLWISITSQIQGQILGVVFLAPVAVILPVNTIPNIVFHSAGYFNQKQMIALRPIREPGLHDPRLARGPPLLEADGVNLEA